MDWLANLPALGIGAVLGATITQIATWVRESRAEKSRQLRDAAYTAMRAAVTLEAFAWACNGHLQDRSSDHAMGMVSEAGTLPQLAEFPSNVEWRSFDTGLASEVLSFPARVNAAQNQAHRLSWEENNHWDSEPAAIMLGVAALELATKIRRQYRLNDGAVPTDVAEDLQAKKSDLERRQAAWRAKMAARSQEAHGGSGPNGAGS